MVFAHSMNYVTLYDHLIRPTSSKAKNSHPVTTIPEDGINPEIDQE